MDGLISLECQAKPVDGVLGHWNLSVGSRRRCGHYQPLNDNLTQPDSRTIECIGGCTLYEPCKKGGSLSLAGGETCANDHVKYAATSTRTAGGLL